MTNFYPHTKPLDHRTKYQQYADAITNKQDTSFDGRFNGPHVLTDDKGWTARCCGHAAGCKWCANEAAYKGGQV
jgi:hypothetical protein